MCVTCGCGRVKKDHGDPRNLTKEDFQEAAEAAKLDMHHLVANVTQAYTEGKLGKGKPKKEEGKLAPFGVWINPRWSSEPTKAVGMKVVSKSSEQRYTLGVAYAPDTPDYTVAQDGYRDQISAQELEKTAWGFMVHPEIGLDHQDGTEGAGQVVESYIYRGPDWTSNGQTIKAGTWLLGVIWSPEAWQRIQSKEITGLSPQGIAKRKVARR
jgi:hypothetical protein